MADKFDDALVGVGMSKAEKKRYKRQQKLLKKFGIRDEIGRASCRERVCLSV